MALGGERIARLIRAERPVHQGAGRRRAAHEYVVVRSRSSLLGAAAALVVALTPLLSPGDEPAPPPRTGFETSGGASWTTHEEEIAFLAEVDARSDRVSVEIIGRSIQNRPLHLVRIGDPAPRSPEAARALPVQLNICSQHGNEPAGREACLRWLRDLAFTDDEVLVEQMRTQTILFIPSANPDGLSANTRGNAAGTDLNRDHLNLETPEVRAMETVVRDWEPSFALDFHEYGPSEPVLYDDDVLYLWPRNLNVDPPIRELGKSFSQDHLRPCLADAGFSSDEYGLAAVGDVDVEQTAGDHDEGISRNAAGLRHSVGILIESAVSPKLTSPLELVDPALNANRRVDSQWSAIACALEFSRSDGDVMRAASEASRRVARSHAPRKVYFDGQDEDTTIAGNRDEPTSVADAPCAYALSADQHARVANALDIHGISSSPMGAGRLVRLAQEARPVIALLLDARGVRHSVEGQALAACPSAASNPSTPSVRPGRVAARPATLPASGVGSMAAPGAVLLGAAAALAVAQRRRKRTEALPGGQGLRSTDGS